MNTARSPSRSITSTVSDSESVAFDWNRFIGRDRCLCDESSYEVLDGCTDFTVGRQPAACIAGDIRRAPEAHEAFVRLQQSETVEL